MHRTLLGLKDGPVTLNLDRWAAIFPLFSSNDPSAFPSSALEDLGQGELVFQLCPESSCDLVPFR